MHTLREWAMHMQGSLATIPICKPYTVEPHALSSSSLFEDIHVRNGCPMYIAEEIRWEGEPDPKYHDVIHYHPKLYGPYYVFFQASTALPTEDCPSCEHQIQVAGTAYQPHDVAAFPTYICPRCNDGWTHASI